MNKQALFGTIDVAFECFEKLISFVSVEIVYQKTYTMKKIQMTFLLCLLVFTGYSQTKPINPCDNVVQIIKKGDWRKGKSCLENKMKQDPSHLVKSKTLYWYGVVNLMMYKDENNPLYKNDSTLLVCIRLLFGALYFDNSGDQTKELLSLLKNDYYVLNRILQHEYTDQGLIFFRKIKLILNEIEGYLTQENTIEDDVKERYIKMIGEINKSEAKTSFP